MSQANIVVIYEVVTCTQVDYQTWETGVIGRFLDRADADRLCLEHNRKLIKAIMAWKPSRHVRYVTDPVTGDWTRQADPGHWRYPTGRRASLINNRAQVVARQVTTPGTLTIWQVWEDRPCPSCEIGGWEVAAVFLDREKALEYAAGRPDMSVSPLQVSL